MATFIASVLALLVALDPVGASLWAAMPHRQESPIIRAGARYAAYAEWDSDGSRVLLDWPWLSTAYPVAELNRQWAACVLVHEAIHVREHTSSEWNPSAWQYVCLDRVGAPQWMKDAVYQRLSDSLRDLGE